MNPEPWRESEWEQFDQPEPTPDPDDQFPEDI
jgi:hypothetical protein